MVEQENVLWADNEIGRFFPFLLKKSSRDNFAPIVEDFFWVSVNLREVYSD